MSSPFNTFALDKGLEKLDEILATANVLAATAGAQPLINEWKSNIMRDAHDTGTYLRSIHVSTVLTERKRVEIEIGTDITKPPYPIFLEYGTHNKDGSVRMKARPTMGPAFRKKKDQAIAEAQAVYSILIEQAFPGAKVST